MTQDDDDDGDIHDMLMMTTMMASLKTKEYISNRDIEVQIRKW